MPEQQGIAKNPALLDVASPPEKLLFREEYEEQLLFSLSRRVNTILYGSDGCGKTTLAKRVLNRLEEKRIKGFYVNCSLFQTSMSVLRELLYKLWDTVGSFRGIISRSQSEIIGKLRQRIKRFKIVVCLDDIEHLKEMDIVRLLVDMDLTVLLIPRQTRTFLKIDEQARSRITNFVKLPTYSEEETGEIVSSWLKETLHESSYSREFINKIVKMCKGNITLARSLVKDAVLRAEARGSKTVDPDDVRFLPILNLELNPEERIIFDILEVERKMENRALFNAYREKTTYPKGERSFRSYMKHLCDRDLVKPVQIGKSRWYEIV